MRFVYEIWRDAFYFLCWFGNFFDWTGRRHEFVVNETMTYIRYYKCLSLFFADFRSDLRTDLYPTFGRIFDGQEICNGHTFEHIYDYDIKLETTKILKHVFDKVGYWRLG